MKKKYLFVFLGVVALLQIMANAIGLCYNVDSIYDEGFLYYCQQSALRGSIGGMSQNTNIIASLLGSGGCETIYGLRIARFCMTLLTAFVFAIMTAGTLIKKVSEKIGYIIICLLMVVPVMGGIVLSYNGLAQLFDCLALAMGYIVLTKESRWNYVCCFLMGILLVFGLFSILPSALLLMGCLFVLLLIRYWKEPGKIGLNAGSVIGGMLVGFTLFHVFVVDLRSVLSAMQDTAASVTTLNRGYDPISFIVKIVLFLRDWMLMGLVVIGVMFISQKIADNTRKWIGGFILIGLMSVYAHYQLKPIVTVAMLMSALWISVLFSNNQRIICRDLFSFDSLLNLFLMFAPLLLSIGTNTYLGGKMAYFLLPWALLLYRLKWHENETIIVFAMSLFVGIGLCTNLIGVPKMIQTQKTIVTEGPLKGMHLTDKQAEHFALCDSIMSEYGFEKNNSVVFTTQLGTMTNCYLGARSYANYFQPMDFVANPSNGNGIPDFLFLCDFDEDIAGETLKTMNWGWPDDFDVFDVGTPEIVDTGYPTTRKLYCRKK